MAKKNTKDEKKWDIEGDNGRRKIKSCQTPIEAMEAAKKMYEKGIKKHTEYCDFLRERHYYQRFIDAMDEKINELAEKGYDLMPDIRVVAIYDDNGNDKEVIWENGEAK